MYDPRSDYDGRFVRCGVRATTDSGEERIVPCKYYGPSIDQHDKDNFVVSVSSYAVNKYGTDKEIVAHKEDLYEY